MYQKTIIDAINFIKDNLEEELTVEDIANHVHFSKYYFNRIFKEEVGESVYAFIKRLKMEKSAIKFIDDRNKSITEVSTSYGYSSSNYSVAFTNHYGVSPKKYKDYFTQSTIKERDGLYSDLSDKDFNYYDRNIKKVKIDDIKVIYKRFIGDYRDIYKQWKYYFDELSEYKYESSMIIEISYNDPIITDPSRCITDLCIATNKKIDKNHNIQVIKGGLYAVYPFEGIEFDILGVFHGLRGIWIQQTKLDIDFDRDIFSIRKLNDKENDHYIFDIYIPYKDSTNSEV